jgi:hypothetical protein
MRILVCGDRNWADRKFIAEVLEDMKDNFSTWQVLIEGEAPGADSIAAKWARRNGITVFAFPADWDLYGRAAGPIRNKQMLDEGKPDMVIAFHDNIEESRGTRNMLTILRKSGMKQVWLYSHNADPRRWD